MVSSGVSGPVPSSVGGVPQVVSAGAGAPHVVSAGVAVVVVVRAPRAAAVRASVTASRHRGLFKTVPFAGKVIGAPFPGGSLFTSCCEPCRVLR